MIREPEATEADDPLADVAVLGRLVRREPWMRDGVCVTRDLPVEVFFPTRGQDVDMAKAICAPCPVRNECLEYALGGGEHFGIWGGTSERERRRIRKRRGLSARPGPPPTADDAKKTRALWLRSKDWKHQEIAAELGVSSRTVIRWLDNEQDTP
jgi:WhiB family redox-sensing transcriptional regulator